MPQPDQSSAVQEPSVVGLKVRPLWSMVLYVLLVSSAALALYAHRSHLQGGLARVAPWLFFVFALGFATYRGALVAARRYSPFKAFIQIMMAALFFLLLLLPDGAPPSPNQQLFVHGDPRVRALAAEVVGYRGDRSMGPGLVHLLDDTDLQVRAAAHQALIRLNQGHDVGPPGDPASRSAWGALFP